MALYYLQGFDIHQFFPDHVSFNVGGVDDAGYEMFGGTPTWPRYQEGHVRGRALDIHRWTGVSLHYYPDLVPRGRICVGAWIKKGAIQGGAFVNIFHLRAPHSSGSSYTDVALRVSSTGEIYLQLDNQTPFDIDLGHLGPNPPLPSDYVYTELYVDFLEGTIRVRREEETGPSYVETVSFTPPSVSTAPIALRIGGTDRYQQTSTTSYAWDFYTDHLWVADRPFQSLSGVGGVSVVAALDRYESVNLFRGGLIIGGQHYRTKYRANSLWSSLNNTRGHNTGNVVSFVFPTDPSTGQPWSQSSFNQIESWGLCYELFNSSSAGDRSRVMAMNLSWLDLNGGRPLVRYQIPGSMTFYSGPWEKRDLYRTTAAHVNQNPRPDTPLEEDSVCLIIGNPGCVFFKNTPDPDTPRPFDEVGLTFASERRDDYNEWYDIVAEALPFQSYFVTGYNVLAEGNKSFQSNYVTVNYVPLPFGSAYIQGLWDYAETGNTGRWSSRQQIYSNSDTRYSNRMRKLKIRGQGNALQMKVMSEDNKPFSINGWTMSASSNASV